MNDPQRPAGPELELVETAADCPHCGTQSLLSAWVPHAWENMAGKRAEGRVRVLLCETCGSDEPYAAGLITFFKVHAEISDDAAMEEFARLVRGWLSQLHVPPVDPDDYEKDIEAWHRGDFD
jgi:Family of unknown function (DUF6300)